MWQVFRFSSSHVEILVVSLVGQITDVRDDKDVEEIADIIRMKMKSRSTCVLIVVDGLLCRTLVLYSLDLLLQNRNSPVLGLKVRAKLLSIG